MKRVRIGDMVSHKTRLGDGVVESVAGRTARIIFWEHVWRGRWEKVVVVSPVSELKKTGGSR